MAAEAVINLEAKDNTKQAFASVQNSLGSLEGKVASVTKGFQLGNILKGVLSGLGIGSGAQIAQAIIENRTAKLKEEADAVDAVNKSTEEQLKLVRENIALRQTEEQQRETSLKVLREQSIELQKQRDAILDTERRTFVPVQKPASFLRSEEENRANVAKKVRDLTAEERVQVSAIATELQRVGNEIDKINVKEDQRLIKLREQETALRRQQRIETLTDVLNKQEHAFNSLLEKQKKANDETERTREVNKKAREQIEQQAEGYLRLIDPLRIYTQQQVEINRLERDGLLTMIEAQRARDAVLKQRQKTQDDMVKSSLDEFFGEMDKIQSRSDELGQAAQEIGFSFASAFESAVLAGDKLSNVMRMLAQDILRVFLRLSVTNPLINSIFGNVAGFSPFPAISFGGPKALGGSVKSGTPYLVGERGPEIFMPSGSGTIVPNHRMGAGGGDTTINVNYNIASGISRAELAPILDTERKRLKAEIPDMVRRGGAYRAAFA